MMIESSLKKTELLWCQGSKGKKKEKININDDWIFAQKQMSAISQLGSGI